LRKSASTLFRKAWLLEISGATLWRWLSTDVEARRHFWSVHRTIRARATMIQNRAIVEATKTFSGQLGVSAKNLLAIACLYLATGP
jgi:hypothetical protein